MKTEDLIPKRLRVGTFNIASYSDPDLLAQNRLITQSKIDVLGLQELDHFTLRQNKNMIQELAQSDFPYYQFTKAIDWHDQGEYGIGMLSKYKVLNQSSGLYDVTGYEDRAYMSLTLQTTQHEAVAIFNTHLAFESPEIRVSQIRQLLQAANEHPAKYRIILGDFNLDQTIDEWQIFLDAGYHLCNGHNQKWFDTFNGRDNEMQVFAIDNIIVSSNIEIEAVAMTSRYLSDHHLLYADLLLQ